VARFGIERQQPNRNENGVVEFDISNDVQDGECVIHQA